MKQLFLYLMTALFALQVHAGSPVTSAFLAFDRLGTYGENFEEVDVTIKVSLEEDHNITAIRCLLIAEEGAPVLFDQWINLNGSDNGEVTISTDPETGELQINLGVFEMPYVYRAAVTARSSDGEIHAPVDAI